MSKDNEGSYFNALTGLWTKSPDDESTGAGIVNDVADDISALFEDDDDPDEKTGGLISDAFGAVSGALDSARDVADEVIQRIGEADPDNDNLTNAEEIAHGTNPWNRDTDGDLRGDGAEVHGGTHRQLRTDPLNKDTDGDGLNDGTELMVTHTDPREEDTDGDSWPDGHERLRAHTDPNDPDDHPAGTGPAGRNIVGEAVTDLSDFITDTANEIGTAATEFAEGDADDDGLTNADELVHGTNALNPDSDGDGRSDGLEVHIDETDPTEPPLLDRAIDGVESFAQQIADADRDADGLGDLSEVLRGTSPDNPDTDADGLLDGWEVDNNTNPLEPDNPLGGPDSSVSEFVESAPAPEPVPSVDIGVDAQSEQANVGFFDEIDDSIDSLTQFDLSSPDSSGELDT